MMNDIATMDRRALLAHIGLLIGASALPVEALAAPRRKPAKRFLTAAQFQLLTAIADTIIPATDTPGAVATGVPGQIDGMLLNWASAERRVAMIGAMAEIDKAAMASLQKGFAALDAAKRKEVLLAFDKEAVKPDPRPQKPLVGLAALLGAGGAPMNPGYVKLKELVITLYYNSEAAMTKELVYEHVPGKFVASFPITPETRPFAGVGGLG
jgi:gluconate 2-dehydrogenase gamma chain